MATSPDMPAGLSAYEAILRLRTWTLSANSYSRSRKNRFRLFSSATKILSLVLSGAATIILGLQNLTFWAGLGFSLVALTTVVNAIEPFFNWRSRWCLPRRRSTAFTDSRRTQISGEGCASGVKWRAGVRGGR